MRQHKYYKLIKVDYEDTGYFYIKNVSNEVGEFSIIKGNGTLEYSTDGANWTSYDLSTKPSVSVNPDSHIYLRGTGFKNNNTDGCINFTKSYTIGGNFMSVNNYSTMTSVTTIDYANYVEYAFKNQTNLISAEKLNFGNVTTITSQGLYGTFYGCTSLTTAPDLSNVTSIGSQGLYSTFFGCTSLTTAPDLSNVTSIGSQGLAASFRDCTSLTTAPDLSNVTSIDSEGLSASFKGCSKLSSVTAPNISDLTQSSVLLNWLDGAGTQATGTKVVNVPTGATITTSSVSGIPTGWTRVDY